jgi:RimJ/RimL family protein N-acetyltransferase
MTALVPLTSVYFETVARWLSDPDVNCLLSAEWRGKNITSTIISIASRNRQNKFFVIYHEEEPCGLVALSDLELADRSAMVWYFMGNKHLRGRGIAGDAIRQLIELAFVEMGLESLYAYVIEGNTYSLRLLKTVGFREVGRIRRASRIAGEQLDRIYFDLIRSDWSCHNSNCG